MTLSIGKYTTSNDVQEIIDDEWQRLQDVKGMNTDQSNERERWVTPYIYRHLQLMLFHTVESAMRLEISLEPLIEGLWGIMLLGFAP